MWISLEQFLSNPEVINMPDELLQDGVGTKLLREDGAEKKKDVVVGQPLDLDNAKKD